MKILAKDIRMIAVFDDGKGIPRPLKFMAVQEGGSFVVRVDKIISCERRRTGGINCFVYCCQSVIDDREVRYELKYIIAECRWQLYKM